MNEMMNNRWQQVRRRPSGKGPRAVAFVTFVAVLLMTAFTPGPIASLALADESLRPDTLPRFKETWGGIESIQTVHNALTVQQGADRAVLLWESFDIGKDAAVHFHQPAGGAALNVVSSPTASMLAGKLTATGSVFLYNPKGIFVTPTGVVDVGGAFVASTLALDDDEQYSHFRGGADLLSFLAPGGTSGVVRNEGSISARDVALLGSRAENIGSEAKIVVSRGRVALGSASAATLDLTGDGFLQVLAPAELDDTDTDALVTNSGVIVADGGRVQLKAASVHQAIREAVHMPGAVRARSISGRDGAIVFSGEGGAVVITGTVDATNDEDEGGTQGGAVEIAARSISFDPDDLRLSPGGRVALAADNVIVHDHEGLDPVHATESWYEGALTNTTVNIHRDVVGRWLRTGVDVSLQANYELGWDADLKIVGSELDPAAADQAGHLHLLAAAQLSIKGEFSTYNGDWRLSANVKPAFGDGPADRRATIWANGYGESTTFLNSGDYRTGRVILEILGGEHSAGLEAGDIDLPARFAGEALTAHIAMDAPGYDASYIAVRGDVDVTDAVTLSGNIFLPGDGQDTSSTATFSGRTVRWLTETEDRLYGGGRQLKFVEDGVVTRFGRGLTTGSGDTEADATRLILGGSSAFTRLYGDADPDQAGLGELLLTLAPHNRVTPGQGAMDAQQTPVVGIPLNGIPLREIFAPGSIAVSGPGFRAEISEISGVDYYLSLQATDQLAFKPLVTKGVRDENCCIDCCEPVPSYVSGAAGAFWIDLSGDNELGNRLPLTITPRPLTAEILYPMGTPLHSYTYGSPDPLVRLDGVVDGDDLRPVISLNGTETPLNPMTSGRFGLDPRTNVGDYVYAMTDIVGERARNYTFDFSGLPLGTVGITPRQLTVRMETDRREQTYGSVVSPVTVSNALSDDDVAPVLRLVDGKGNDAVLGPRLDAGEYTLSVAGLGGLDAGNYDYELIGFTGTGTARLTVTPKLLSWTVSNTTTTYGDGVTPTVALQGVVGDDDIFLDTEWVRSGASGNVFSTGGHRAAGEYTLWVDGISGNAKHNYRLGIAGPTDDKWTVFPRLLHLPLTGSVAYGDPLVIGPMEPDAVLPGDDLQFQLTLQDAPPGPHADPGVYVGVFSALIGVDAANYQLRDPNAPGRVNLTITKRPVTFRVLDQTRTYGDDPRAVAFEVDNVLPGDHASIRDVTFWAAPGEGNRGLLSERTSVGSYTLQIASLRHSKYELAADGHTAGRIVIERKPIRYTTPDWEVEYGKVDPYLGMAVLNEADIVSGDDVRPGTVVVANRELYPERLQVNDKYPLALAGLTGSASDNYVIQHAGSTQGLLTVTPKTVRLEEFVLQYNGAALDWRIWNFGDLESMYGFAQDEDGGLSVGVELSGVLPGDDVSAAILRPELEYSSQRYLAAGNYVWTLSGLVGQDSGNYVLDTGNYSSDNGKVNRSLEIGPRQVRLYAEKTGLEYGQAVPNVDLGFDDDNAKFFDGAALDVTNIVFRSTGGAELTWDDLWNGPPVRLNAGLYFARILDESKPFLIGPDAKNFNATLGGYIEISPRTLYFTPPPATSWVYGRAISQRSLYDAVVDRDGTPGVLSGDDVGFQYWTVGRGISETNFGEILDTNSIYNSAGEYAGFGFRLTGADAGNYNLIQPDYTVTILPRPLEFPLDWLYPGDDGRWEYVIDFTDVLRPWAGEHGGVLREHGDEEEIFIGVRADDGIVRPVHETDAGRYDMQSLTLTGRQARNYELVIRQPDAFLRINPRELLFSIGDVDGHYGNFVACWDPRTCNGGPRGPHGDRHLWVPGLKLGDVELEGILPGHDVSAGEVILIDGAGRRGRLEDMPQPGVYFQVVDGLVGADARNYRIASSGSRPGILTIFPQWVRWETTDGIYMPETGFRSLNPNPDYDAHPYGELLPGLQATVTGAHGDLDLDPKFQFVGLDINTWEDTFIGNPRNLRPGNYSIEVAGFAGDAGALYQPVPGSMSHRGILSVFADSRLGLESVGTIDGDLVPPAAGGAGSSVPATGGGSGTPAIGSGIPATGSGTPATGSGAAATGVGNGSETNSFGFGDQFGARVNPELFNTAGLRGGAYAEALAEYGVTGVKLKAGAGIEVEYQIGSGYVRTGAEARAVAELGPTGVSGSARVTATVGGGAAGSLGGGLDGRAETHVGVMAGAEGKAGLMFEDGNFKLGTKAHAGAGVSVGAEGSLSWHAGSVDAGVTVYSPGSIGQNFSFGAGMDGAVLTIDAVLGVALGFGGIELDLGFSIDLGGLRDVFESFACGSGLASCSPSQMELGETYALAALDIQNPLERFAYLYQNDEWRYIGGAIQAGENVGEDVARAYFENRAVFDYVQDLLTDVERYITEQEQAQAQFFRYLEEDPMSALNMARNTYSDHNYFTRQAQSIHERMTAIGVQLELRRENLAGLGLD